MMGACAELTMTAAADAVYLHHLPQLLTQVDLDPDAVSSQHYHTTASIAVN